MTVMVILFTISLSSCCSQNDKHKSNYKAKEFHLGKPKINGSKAQNIMPKA
jgi:hypothetical protein